MEGIMVQNQENSGKITRHNTHLLDDDIMKDSLDGNRPQSTGTHSSEESRLIDRSPDRYEDAGSEGSIETEKQYQEDLKKRVKRSFAELGLNPNTMQENNERPISPSDSLEAPDDMIDKETEENDEVLRDSIEDYAVMRNEEKGSHDNVNREPSFKKQEFVQQNNNNSGGSNNNDADDNNDYPSAYSNNTSLPVNDDLQLRTNSTNNLQETERTNNSRNQGSSNSYLNNRTRHVEKTSVNSPIRKPLSGRNTGAISPENKAINLHVQTPTKLEENYNVKNQIETLPGGEQVRVEYISDDSGDEDEHYVDEKGSPVHFDSREKASQQVYKIKPRPPDSPVDASKQSIKLRRYSLERRQTPTKQGNLNTNAGILSIQKVLDADVAGLGEFERKEETCIAANDTGNVGNIESSIPNHMKVQTSRDASAPPQKDGSKFVDAEVYAKLQLKSQQKIKSREASADSHSKKGKGQQPSSRHDSPNKKKDRPPINGSTKKAHHLSKLDNKRNNHNSSAENLRGQVNGKQTSADGQSLAVEAHLQYERKTSEQEKFSSWDQEITEPFNRSPLEDYQDSEKQSYQTQSDQFGVQQPSNMPYMEPDYQQNHQESYQQGSENDDFYRGSDQQSQYPAHPIQPAYQPVPLQQQGQGPSQQPHYTQNSAPYQGPPQQLHYSQGSAPYQGPHQQNQMSYFNPQVQTKPEYGQYQNESNMYHSNQPNIQNYNQYYQSPYNNQNIVSYQSNQPGNQVRGYQGQPQLLNQMNPMFHNPHIYQGGSAVSAQQFYNQQPQHFQQQQISQPHIQPPHQSFYGSSQQPYGMQNQQYDDQPLTYPREEIPPLDLRGIVDDDLQVQQQIQRQPQVSKNSSKKIDKSKINFIEHNKVKLRKELPERGYLDRYKKDINPRKPLPSISRANSDDGYYDQWQDNDGNYDQAWITNPGSEKRYVMQLPRQQSDTAVRYSNMNLRNLMSPEEISSNYPQSAPVNFEIRTTFQNQNDHSSSPTWPSFNAGGSNIQFASFSADHATSYARMQYKPKVLSKLENSPRLSMQRPGPYPVLPNIQDTDTNELRTSDQDGYLAKMQKAKQEPQYKKYTLKDYQKLKVDTKLGGLGPDIEAAQEKQEKAIRQREYAKQVMMKNRKTFKQSKAQGWMPPPETPQEKGPTKRDIAIEYSKRVPKPRLPTPPEEKHEKIYGAPGRENSIDTENEMKQLEQLRLRHEKEKQEVAKIKHDIVT